MSSIHKAVPHPHIARRKEGGPPKTADVAVVPAGASWVARFNSRLAVKITAAVGTMACAYVFTVIALISLPSVLKTGDLVAIVAWVAQTFLQLVLLSIIIVGQNIQASASDKRAEATYNDADAVLHTSQDIQAHLEAQDAEIEKILAELRSLQPAKRAPAAAKRAPAAAKRAPAASR